MGGRKIVSCPRALPTAAERLRKVTAPPPLLNRARGGIVCSLSVIVDRADLRGAITRDVQDYFWTMRCAVPNHPDIAWFPRGNGHYVTQSLIAPRFVRAAAMSHLREIIRCLAQTHDVPESAIVVICAFVEVNALEAIGGVAVRATNE